MSQNVTLAKKNKKNLSDISLEEFQHFENSINKDIYDYIDVEKSFYRKKTKMSTNPKLVSKQIDKYSNLLK